jgi:hypothetical protein
LFDLHCSLLAGLGNEAPQAACHEAKLQKISRFSGNGNNNRQIMPFVRQENTKPEGNGPMPARGAESAFEDDQAGFER